MEGEQEWRDIFAAIVFPTEQSVRGLEVRRKKEHSVETVHVRGMEAAWESGAACQQPDYSGVQR